MSVVFDLTTRSVKTIDVVLNSEILNFMIEFRLNLNWFEIYLNMS